MEECNVVSSRRECFVKLQNVFQRERRKKRTTLGARKTPKRDRVERQCWHSHVGEYTCLPLEELERGAHARLAAHRRRTSTSLGEMSDAAANDGPLYWAIAFRCFFISLCAFMCLSAVRDSRAGDSKPHRWRFSRAHRFRSTFQSRGSARTKHMVILAPSLSQFAILELSADFLS